MVTPRVTTSSKPSAGAKRVVQSPGLLGENEPLCQFGVDLEGEHRAVDNRSCTLCGLHLGTRRGLIGINGDVSIGIGSYVLTDSEHLESLKDVAGVGDGCDFILFSGRLVAGVLDGDAESPTLGRGR